jgi:hypothetical protein
MESQGYFNSRYAAALAEWGTPVALPSCGASLLRRPITESSHQDLMGCYPVFCAQDYSRLFQDLSSLSGEYVSLALVVDSFSGVDETFLRAHFDRVLAFKAHFAAELDRPWEQIANKHHRYYARKALTKLVVEPVVDPLSFLDEWCELYGHLVRRHELRGIKAFSRQSFAAQLALPGLVALRATHEGQTVGAHLWMHHEGVAQSHLAAFNDLGYELMAAYALYAGAIQHFTGKVRWLNFGAGAGLSTDASDGLTQFKRGWSTTSRTAWFCGKILQPETYASLTTAAGKQGTNYFPAYRQGEF